MKALSIQIFIQSTNPIRKSIYKINIKIKIKILAIII